MCCSGTDGGVRHRSVAVCRKGIGGGWARRPPGATRGSEATMAPVIFLVGGVRSVLGVALRPVPTGALYSTLLLLHVLCAVVGFGTMVATGVQAARARRGPSAPG